MMQSAETRARVEAKGRGPSLLRRVTLLLQVIRDFVGESGSPCLPDLHGVGQDERLLLNVTTPGRRAEELDEGIQIVWRQMFLVNGHDHLDQIIRFHLGAKRIPELHRHAGNRLFPARNQAVEHLSARLAGARQLEEPACFGVRIGRRRCLPQNVDRYCAEEDDAEKASCFHRSSSFCIDSTDHTPPPFHARPWPRCAPSGFEPAKMRGLSSPRLPFPFILPAQRHDYRTGTGSVCPRECNRTARADSTTGGGRWG